MFLAFNAPAKGQVASAITEYPSAEAVNAKQIVACAVNCNASTLSIGLNNFLQVDERRLIVERLDKEGNVLVGASYVMPLQQGRDRYLRFDIDVAILPGAAVRARFDGCDTNETQWVIINYDEVRL